MGKSSIYLYEGNPLLQSFRKKPMGSEAIFRAGDNFVWRKNGEKKRANHSDLTRPISSKRWRIGREMGPLISGKSRLVKYYLKVKIDGLPIPEGK